MIYVFFADGFEEIEAIAPVDILRRAGFEVITVGVGDVSVTSSHGVTVVCDTTTLDVDTMDVEAVVLPGGMPGAENLERDVTVNEFIEYAVDNEVVLGAICAAPRILGHKGLLKGKRAVCYPGYEKELEGAVICGGLCETDEKIVTARGAGAAYEFGFALVDLLTGSHESSDRLRKSMQYRLSQGE